MAKRKARKRDPAKTKAAAVSAPAARTAPAPRPRPESFGISFCVLGFITLIVGTGLTFHWMASLSEPKFLGSGDTWQYYGPVISYMDHSIHHGEFPLWNPLYFCGQPFAANPQSFLFYPPNLLRSLLTFDPTPIKTHTGIAVVVVLQLLLAGMSSFFLARRHALTYGAALLAAFAFVFSAPLVTRATGHWIFVNSVCWYPLTLLLLNYALSQKVFRRQAAFSMAAALSWGMTILGGVPFLIVLGAVIIGLYAVLFRLLAPVASAEHNASAPPKRPKRRPARIMARDATALAIVIIGGVLIAAPLLLPGYEFSQHTERAVKSDDAHEDFAPVEAGWDFLRMLIVYQGHGHYEGIRSSGAIVFMLALVALLCRPGRNVLLFGGILVVMLDCSLSKPLLFGRLLNAVAPFQMGNPGRSMLVACLPLGLLAGLGADAALKCPRSLRARLFRSAVVAAAGILVVSVVARAPRPEPVLPVGPLVIVLPALACLLAIAAVWFPEPVLWGAALAMFVLGETLAWNRCLIPSVVPDNNRYPGPMDQLAREPQFWAGNQRGTDLKPNLKMYALQGVMNGYDPMHLREVRDVLCTTPENKAFRRIIYAPETTAFSNRGNLFLKRQFWLARQYVNGPLPNRHRNFPSTTTVFLKKAADLPVPKLDPAQVPRSAVSSQAKEIWLKKPGSQPVIIKSKDVTSSDSAIPLKPLTIPRLHSALSLTLKSTCAVDLRIAFVDVNTGHTELGRIARFPAAVREARTVEIPMPDIQDLQIVLMPDFRGATGELAFLEALIRSDYGDEGGRISVLSRSANTAEVELKDLPDYRLLVNIDAFYPGWQAYIDGEPTKIYRADDVFKAVLVPPGRHRVRFVFRPASVMAGLIVSFFTLAAICASMFILLRKTPGQPFISTSCRRPSRNTSPIAAGANLPCKTARP